MARVAGARAGLLRGARQNTQKKKKKKKRRRKGSAKDGHKLAPWAAAAPGLRRCCLAEPSFALPLGAVHAMGLLVHALGSSSNQPRNQFMQFVE
jgi:hypothetical protein